MVIELDPIALQLAALFKTYVSKVCLQRSYLAGRDDRSDIAVGTHEHPIAGR